MSAAALRKDTFASLSNPNFRRYFAGQSVSNIGNWMQIIGQSWLVLQLTGSATALGAVVACQTLPVLLLGAYGGVVADRSDKRRLLIKLMAAKGVLALILGLLVVSGTAHLWHVFVLAAVLGLTNCFEMPTRQSFVQEIVGPDHLRNAISLNSVLVNGARTIGPAAAGTIIATGGIGACFLINAASFLAPLLSLSTMDVSSLHPSPPSGRARGQLREGLAYVRATPAIAVPLIMMALIGCLAYEFQVVLPIVAKETFGGGAQAYGFMTAAMGVGAVGGGLWIAARGRVGVRSLVNSSVAFGAAIMAAAVAPTLELEIIALLFVGGTSVGCMSKGSSTLQLAADPRMRGRVMSLWTVAVMGSTPIGGPIAGACCQFLGARSGLVLGALSCFAAAGIGLLAMSTPSKRRALGDGGVSPVQEAVDNEGAELAPVPRPAGPGLAEQPLPASSKAAYISGDVKIAGSPIGLP